MNPQNLGKQQFKDIVERYLRQEATPEEIEFVEKWYEQLGAKGQLLWNSSQQDAIKERILSTVNARRHGNTATIEQKSSFTKWFAAAAAIVISAVSAYYFINTRPAPAVAQQIEAPKSESFKAGKLVKKITLPDESVIFLQPFSVVTVYAFGQTDKREVSLEGEAFFNVTRDESKPFFVYTGKIATRVLGTSFNIITKGDAVEVAVKTGLVSVAEMVDSTHTERTSREEILLTPNQRATYNAGDMKKSLIANPRPVPSATITPTGIFMKFDEAPVSEIFEAIEKAYGIELSYDSEEIKNCRLTTHLQDESLHDRLKIICTAIHGSYEINDMRVIIKSTGCPQL